jgi:hypothetical protein
MLIDEPHIPLAHLEDTLEGEYATSVTYAPITPVDLGPLLGLSFLLALYYVRFTATGKTATVQLVPFLFHCKGYSSCLSCICRLSPLWGV